MSSSLNATPSSSSSVQAKPTWEDDAWKIDSDDDEFVKASRAATTSRSNGSQKGKPGGARHAPPARPHVYPLSSEEEASSSRASIPKVRVMSEERPSIGSTGNTASQSGWTLIERSGSGASASPGAGGDTPTAPGEGGGGEGSRGEGKPVSRRCSEAEAKEMTTCIEEDLDDVLRGKLRGRCNLACPTAYLLSISRAHPYRPHPHPLTPLHCFRPSRRGVSVELVQRVGRSDTESSIAGAGHRCRGGSRDS